MDHYNVLPVKPDRTGSDNQYTRLKATLDHPKHIKRDGATNSIPFDVKRLGDEQTPKQFSRIRNNQNNRSTTFVSSMVVPLGVAG